MKIELFSFCDFAQENAGKLTVVGTFDTILSRNYPCIHPQFSVVIRLRFDLWEFSNHEFVIEAKDMDGAMPIKPIQGNLEVKGAGNATAVSHLVFTISSLRLKCPGVIIFALYIDGRELASIPLYLNIG